MPALPNQQAVALELFYDGVWNDLVATGEVFADAPITIVRGQGDEGAALRPCKITASLDNTSDKYRTSNPMSPLYGKVGRNTPIRVKVGGHVRGTAEVSSWSPDQTIEFRQTPARGRAWTDIEASGMLGRIAQWTEPLKSPFRQYNETIGSLAGYFPMEDARGSTRATSTVPGAFNRSLLGVNFDSQRRPPGSAPLADVEAPGAAFGLFEMTGGQPADNIGWQYSLIAYFDEDLVFFTPIALTLRNGWFVFVALDDSTNLITVTVNDTALANVAQLSTNWGSFNWVGRWITLGLNCTVSGGTVNMQVLYRGIDDAAATSFSTSFTGISSSPRSARISGFPKGSSVGHLLATNDVTGSFLDDRFLALNGYDGETAADRFARLCELRGISFSVIGDPASSALMGPQAVDTFTAQLQEILATEDGLIFDSFDGIELTLLLRNARYNQVPALELTFGVNVAPPLREVTDDLDVHNIVTASQRGGNDYVARDDTGPVGTLPPPDGAGEYKQTVEINSHAPDTDGPKIANWWMRRGTVGLPRFPTVTVDLVANPEIITAAESVDIGSVITISGFREYVIRLYVLGIKEVIGTHTRTITYTCAPDQQFVVGVYDADRYDARSTTLKTAVSSSAVSLTFRTAVNAATWSTTSEPYNVLISGELITVTSMGSPSLVSGAMDQVATVTRAVNGISKSLSAGEPIHIAAPGRYAL